jgi:hypothetical protein
MDYKEPSDPVIDEIREIRHRISEEFGHDPAKLVEHYRLLQERYANRLIAKPEERSPRSSSEGV